MKVCIFDMDGTLLDSPLPDPGKKEYERIKGKPYPHNGWWGRVESLLPEFDIKPKPDVLSHYHRSTEDGSIKIMLTNRLYRLKPQIMDILEKNKLYFHYHSFKYDGRSKLDRALDIMKEQNYTDVNELEVFEDMVEHIRDFSRIWELRPDIQTTIHFVKPDGIISATRKEDLKW